MKKRKALEIICDCIMTDGLLYLSVCEGNQLKLSLAEDTVREHDSYPPFLSLRVICKFGFWFIKKATRISAWY